MHFFYVDNIIICHVFSLYTYSMKIQRRLRRRDKSLRNRVVETAGDDIHTYNAEVALTIILYGAP